MDTHASPWRRWPAWAWALLAAGAVLLAAAALPLLHWLAAPPPAASPLREQGLPWQVESAGPGRARVFGLEPGHSRLADAQQRFGADLHLAVVGRLGEPPALEALVEPMQAGYISGRLVMDFEVEAATLAAWQRQAPSSRAMEGGTRGFELPGAARAEAARAPLRSLSFLPSLKLTEADILQRFGAAPQRQPLGEGSVRLGYPALGVAVTVAPGQRPLIQYVRPADAGRLLGLSPAASGG